MYFLQSANIAKAHESLSDLVEQLDELIYETGDTPIRPGLVADSFDTDEDTVIRVLEQFVNAGLLREEPRRYCAKCEALIDEEDGPDECDDCETPFSRMKPDQFLVFTPVDPIIRTDVFDAIEDELPKPCRIQFVGGDRDGSALNSLKLPKEHNAIANGLRQSSYSHQFSMVESVYAATIQQLGDLYANEPRLIHFAGHGDERSLSFIKDQELLASTVPVTAEKLGRILSHFPKPIAAVVFNTCKSADIAEAIVDAGVVDIAIGWTGKVSDAAAINFSELFYKHLGNGLSLGSAFGLASECAVPAGATFEGKLFSRPTINPKAYFLHDQ